MIKEDVLAGLAAILAEIAGVKPTEVSPEKRFAQDLGVDSMAMIEVVVAAEDRFGVAIRDDDIDDLTTVGEAVGYIQRLGVAA